MDLVKSTTKNCSFTVFFVSFLKTWIIIFFLVLQNIPWISQFFLRDVDAESRIFIVSFFFNYFLLWKNMSVFRTYMNKGWPSGRNEFFEFVVAEEMRDFGVLVRQELGLLGELNQLHLLLRITNAILDDFIAINFLEGLLLLEQTLTSLNLKIKRANQLLPKSIFISEKSMRQMTRYRCRAINHHVVGFKRKFPA